MGNEMVRRRRILIWNVLNCSILLKESYQESTRSIWNYNEISMMGIWLPTALPLQFYPMINYLKLFQYFLFFTVSEFCKYFEMMMMVIRLPSALPLHFFSSVSFRLRRTLPGVFMLHLWQRLRINYPCNNWKCQDIYFTESLYNKVT